MVFDNQGAVNLGSAYGTIIVDMRDTQRNINSQVRNLENGIAASMGRIGDRLQSIGSKLTLTLSPVTLFATRGIAAYAKFDDILTEIAARTGATADEMERVKATALQMGQDTAFSANQAADAMLQLLSSGYDLEDTFTALQPVLNLAAAGALDLGYAADAVTDILAQFRLGADKAVEVSDALAQASGSSSATINQLIDAFANVGPLASSFGLSVDDTAAILAVFAENGIKGADAGTQLKSMLTNLSRDVPEVQRMWDDLGVSLYDSDGNFRDLNTVIEDLGGAMDGMSDEERNNVIQTLAGSYGQMGLQILLAAGGYDEMAAAMSEAATAEELAAARMESFKGKVNQLKSSVETLSLNVLGPLVENYLEPLVMSITDVINKINEWLVANPDLANGIGIIVGILATMGPAIFSIGYALSLLAVFLNPISLVTAAIAGLAFAFREQLAPALELIKDAFNLFTSGQYRWATFDTLGNPIDGVAAKILNLREMFLSAADRVRWFVEFVKDAFNLFTSGQYRWATFDTLGNPIDGVAAKILKLREDFSSLGERVAHFIKFVKDAFNLFTSGQYRWAMFDTLGSRIDGVAAKILNLREVFLSAADRVRWFVEFVKDAFKLFTSGQYRWATFDTLGNPIDGIAAKILNLREVFLSAADRVRWFVGFVQDSFRLLASGDYVADMFATLGHEDSRIVDFILDIREQFIAAKEAVENFFNAWGGWDRVRAIFDQLRNGADQLLEPLGGVNAVLSWIAKTILGILIPPLGVLMTVISLIQFGLRLLSGEANDAIKSVMDFFNDAGDAAGDFIDSIPEQLEKLAESFVTWVEPIIPQLLQSLAQIGQSILTWLDQVIPQVVSGALQLGTAFLEWLGPTMRTLLLALGYMLGQAIRWLMTEGIPQILPALNEFLVAIGNFIINDLVPGIIGFGVLLVHGFLQGIRELISSGQLEQWAIDILRGIADGFAQIVDGATWVYDNILKPLWDGARTAISQIDWASVGQSLLDAFGAALSAIITVGTWVWNNIISPIADDIGNAIGQIDWASVGQSLLDAFGAALSAIVTVGSWVWDNIISPIADDIGNAIGQIDFSSIVSSFFNLFGQSFGMSLDILGWVYEHIIGPIGNALMQAPAALLDAVVEYGPMILGGILAGFGLITYWVWTNIVQPFFDQLVNSPETLVLAVIGWGSAILGGILNGLGDILQWLNDNVLQPFLDGLGDAPEDFFNAMKSAGESILDGLAEGIGALASWVEEHIVGPILSPLREAQNVINGLMGRNDAPSDAAVLESENSPANLFPGAKPQDNGGIGRAGSIYRVGRSQVGAEFFGVGDQGHFYPDFMDNLTRVAGMVMRQSIPQPALAASGGSGNTYNLEINIPLDVLRDEPNLQRNADTFADQIMSRLRSR